MAPHSQSTFDCFPGLTNLEVSDLATSQLRALASCSGTDAAAADRSALLAMVTESTLKECSHEWVLQTEQVFPSGSILTFPRDAAF